MIRLSTLMLICLSFTSISIAQQVPQQYEDHNIESKTTNKKKKVESYLMVQHFIMNAEKMDLTYSQRQKLDNIKQEYLYPMIQNEAEFQISEMNVMDLLRQQDFEPEKIKSAIQKSINITLQNALMSIDALAAIREAVGIDNFNILREMMNLIPKEMRDSEDKLKKNKGLQNEKIKSL